MPRPVLVSACLLGLCSRYNLELKSHPQTLKLFQRQDLTPIPVCPEQLGGLPTPRPASRLEGGDGRGVLEGTARVLDAQGRIVTEAFLKGARETLKIARLTGSSEAIMKERSPSCAVTTVQIGDRMQPGRGVTTALLERSGLSIYSEQTCTRIPVRRSHS